MSDDEIKKRIERLKLENEYRTASKKEQKKETARKFVSEVMLQIGKNTLTNIGSQAATHAFGTLINKACGVDIKNERFKKADGSFDKELYQMYRIVNPQKGQSDKK